MRTLLLALEPLDPNDVAHFKAVVMARLRLFGAFCVAASLVCIVAAFLAVAS